MPFFLSRGGRCNRRRSGPIQAPPRASSSTAAASTEAAEDHHHHLADTCTTTADSDHHHPHRHHHHHHQMSMSMPMVVPLHGQWDATQADDASHKRQRQTSWCSTAGASEPIDIPPNSNSPRDDDHFFGEYQTITTALTGGDYDNNTSGISVNGYSSAPCRPDASGGEVGCWSASWYRSEPWKNSEALDSGTPEKPPAHIVIWEERSASQAAAAMAAREDLGRRALSDADGEEEDDELPSRGDTSSEDSIFEMDM